MLEAGKENNIFSPLDYLKLYLANVFGKGKLIRKNRIKWVDENIEKKDY